MAISDPAKLSRPFGVDKLLEIRTSRMKKMAGIDAMSGIDKTICSGPMKLTKLGLEGDEHDPTFHGGPDKAILGYCASHYSDWKASYPDRVDRFVPGGFGENFVTASMNERNVCIGDVIAVGPEVILQVSLPRQPCFKLNHRFSLKNFAPETYKTSRTGWYYRVIREGMVNVGDEIKLVERKWPKWTIERVQEYLHRDTTNLAMNEELAAVEALGEESRGQFRNRVAKARRKSRKEVAWRDFKIVSRKAETPRIISLQFRAVTQDTEAEQFPLGSHVQLKLPNGLTRSYSMVSRASSGSKEDAGNAFELGIALEEHSRGGSRYLHEAKVGDTVQVGKITSDVVAASAASMHVFVAGGIGITAFLPMLEAMDSINWAFHLHYAVRSAEEVPFKDRLEPLSRCITIYDKSKGERMDIGQVVEKLPWNSHLYVCGPGRMMGAAKEAVELNCIPPTEVHFEAFTADVSGDPFEAQVANKGNKVIKVAEDESLLEALRREFGDVASSCEVGNCGTCKVTLESGSVDHRGVALLPDEKRNTMLSCVSRGNGRITISI